MKLIDRVHQRWTNWALKKCKNNRTHAAKLLGISVRTFRQWKKKYNISAPLPLHSSFYKRHDKDKKWD